MVISLPVSKANSDTAGEKHLTASQTTQEQKSELEEKLENLLENAEGVGKVKVMLMEDGRRNRSYGSPDRGGRGRQRSNCPEDSAGSDGIISDRCA